MARVYLVRHGRAAASFTEDLDPDLDPLGHSQTAAVGQMLAGKLPLALISSLLRRAREAAAPLQLTTGQNSLSSSVLLKHRHRD